MDAEALESAGLTKNEAKVYLACLQLGSALASVIAKKSGVDRGIIYVYLEQLMKKGLVSCIVKSGRKYFEAARPERLVELLREKEQIVLSALPELTKIHESKPKTSVKFFEGKEGLKAIFEDVLVTLKENGTHYVAGARAADLEALKYFLPIFHKNRIRRKIHINLIYNHDDLSIQRAKFMSKMKYGEARILPKNYEMPSSIHIYENKFALMIIPEPREEQLAILVENQKMAVGMKRYFELLWKMSEKP